MSEWSATDMLMKKLEGVYMTIPYISSRRQAADLIDKWDDDGFLHEDEIQIADGLVMMALRINND